MRLSSRRSVECRLLTNFSLPQQCTRSTDFKSSTMRMAVFLEIERLCLRRNSKRRALSRSSRARCQHAACAAPLKQERKKSAVSETAPGGAASRAQSGHKLDPVAPKARKLAVN